MAIGAITPQYNGCTQESLSVTATLKNQISGFCYDAAGNLLIEGPCGPTLTYQYDAENRMTATAGVSYAYDGDGRRVKKSTGKLYWYGASGLDALLETDLAGNTPTEFVFFGGKRIARRDSSGSISYFFADHLGSSRVVTNSSGTVVEDSDFYPFGGERVVVNNDPNQYKFTGKERDTESGLDYFGARFYASTMGRFQTPDPYMPSADVKDPQSWNRYVYARNNPLRYIDPNGLDWSDLSGEQRRVFQTYADDYCKQNKEFCEKNKGEQLTEKIYGTLSQSQMATFESVTYALEHTQLVDSNGNSMGNALQQVAGVTSIAGEVPGASGDQQFRIFADLKPGAIETFAKAQGFEASSNKVLGLFQIYHKGFPDSFRQIRQEGVKGMEAGLQPSYNSSNRKADIDVDYRFGAAHLKPANSDVRAPGNYQKFIDRWPGLRNWWDK